MTIWPISIIMSLARSVLGSGGSKRLIEGSSRKTETSRNGVVAKLGFRVKRGFCFCFFNFRDVYMIIENDPEKRDKVL